MLKLLQSLALALLLAAGADPLRAAPAGGEGAAPAGTPLSAAEADAVIKSLGDAYRSAKSLSFTLTSSAGSTFGGKHEGVSHLEFKRPGLFAGTTSLDGVQYQFTSDGHACFSRSSAVPGSYGRDPNSAPRTVRWMLMRGAVGFGFAATLLSMPDADELLFPESERTIARLPGIVLDGVACDQFSVVMGQPQIARQFILAIARTDHLLRRIERASRFFPVSETLTNVKLNADVSDAVFAFAPKPGETARPVPQDPVVTDAPPAKAPFPVPGTLPPPIQAVDLTGKAIRLGDYAGKVLLVHFWSTKILACDLTMPAIASAYIRYHPKGLEMVGISLDGPTARTSVDAFMKLHRLTWPQIYPARGADYDLAEAYRVEDLPATVLIGRDGKVAAVDLVGGFMDDLPGTIVAALAAPAHP